MGIGNTRYTRVPRLGLGSRFELIPAVEAVKTECDSVEGASMVRRAPFPLNGLPAYIEHAVKILCVCVYTQAPGTGTGRINNSSRIDGFP